MTAASFTPSDLSRHTPGLHIGLTGGIGSGKSTVGHILVRLGAHLIDTDAISRSLTAAGGRAMPVVRHEFGAGVLEATGALNRQRMRELIFHDPQAKLRLEAILHPLIHDETLAQAKQAGPKQALVFDVPLLVESGQRWRERVDRILVIDCEPETQIQRVMSRSGWSRDMVERVIAQQASRQARAAAADAVLLNDGISLDDLERAVRSVWQRWGLPIDESAAGPGSPLIPD